MKITSNSHLTQTVIKNIKAAFAFAKENGIDLNTQGVKINTMMIFADHIERKDKCCKWSGKPVSSMKDGYYIRETYFTVSFDDETTIPNTAKEVNEEPVKEVVADKAKQIIADENTTQTNFKENSMDAVNTLIRVIATVTQTPFNKKRVINASFAYYDLKNADTKITVLPFKQFLSNAQSHVKNHYIEMWLKQLNQAVSENWADDYLHTYIKSETMNIAKIYSIHFDGDFNVVPHETAVKLLNEYFQTHHVEFN